MLKKPIIRKATKEEIEKADALVKKGILRTTYEKSDELMKDAMLFNENEKKINLERKVK